MAILSLNQASVSFAKLIERVEAGEYIAIASGVGPPLQLEALSPRSKKRMPGKRRMRPLRQAPKKFEKRARRLSPPFFKG